jgi:4-amino-4-deoxy-L-arabinose transferase-like glycosyltransferase
LVVAAPVAVGIIAAALGIWRLMPGVGYWDTAEFQTIPPILGTAHPTGYPTFVILGWLGSIALGPLGDAAFRMNLLSAILVGVAAALTVDLVRLLTRSTGLGAVAGLGLAATPIVWSIGTHADPHALHLAFVAAILWLLVRWERARAADPAGADLWLVAAAVVTGLSAGNHSLTLLLALPIGLYVLAVEPRIVLRGRFVLICAAAVILPAILVYLELPLRGGGIASLRAPLVYGTPATWDGFKYVVLGEQFRGGITDPFGELPRKLVDLTGLATRQLGPLAILVVIGFFATAIRQPPYALLTGTALVITCFFNAAYVNADIERYYLGPAVIAWTWLAVLAATVIDLVASALSVGDDPDRPPSHRLVRLIQVAGVGVAALLLLAPTAATFPERAADVDHTTDTSASRWLDAVLEEVEPDAMIVSWWSYSTPLWYAQQIEHRRQDIAIVDDRTRLDENLGDLTTVIDRNLSVRPVYAIRIDQNEMRTLRERYNVTPLASPIAGNVYRITPRVTSTASMAPAAAGSPAAPR